MRTRILKFIESEGITAAEFADNIGVQRSSVSHVLNGRNNPGFAFIQKILEAYPAIDSRWLLTGSEQKDNQKAVNDITSNAKNDLFSTNQEKPLSNGKENTKTVSSNINPETTEHAPVEQIAPSSIHSEKKVIKVLIFYDDHTFEDFRPAK